MISTAIPLIIAAAAPSVYAAATQPTSAGTGPGTFEIIGESGVSAQQLFLGGPNTVYIIDKVQNNKATINGHPAWATEYDLTTNTVRAMDVVTNTFCAGGATLGDGRMLVVGGNQAVVPGGDSLNSSVPNVYGNGDGGQAVRTLLPCEDKTCNYVESTMQKRRWYPTLEPLSDGSAILIGGNMYGGFVNSQGNNEPTYEFWPSRGSILPLRILETTLPANLYPLTWLMPSGKLFIQTNWAAELFDPDAGVEDPLPDVPHAVRTYPASAATVLLPLTPGNNYTAKVLMCGGSDLQPAQWTAGLDMTQVAASASCVTMSPDVDREWHEDDDLPDGRVMGNFILLPDGTIWLGNGANVGTAGYGTEPWTKGDSYADMPLYSPLIYNPDAPAGSRFSSEGMSPSTIARMYHSTATLLPDGAVFVAGSSPHPDVVLDNTMYPTEYRVEKFYPWYYAKRRPEPTGVPTTLGYGGDSFDILLSKTDLNEDGATALEQTKVVVIRTGFSTHAVNFGQRYLQLENTYTLADDGSATLHVSQMPPNANLFAPGPAWLYVVVNGVPSMGQKVMIGSGTIEVQEIKAVKALPEKSVPTGTKIPEKTETTAGNPDAANNKESGAIPRMSLSGSGMLIGTLALGLVALGFL
ncbi:hypothetical protein FRC02_009003 [Tulasnella sp. 418]|nr:hypothetical protein FRC02_009003 [Tulasnella sp. 418]